MAVARGHFDIAKLLIERGCFLNIATDEGDTPLMYAADTNNWPLVNLLLVRGANPVHRNANRETPLRKAVKHGWIGGKQVRELLEKEIEARRSIWSRV